MSTTIEKLAEQAMKLPAESRAKLAGLLVKSLDLDGPEALRKRETLANDLEIINSRADDLNEEALDVLDYQVAL